MMRTAAPGMLDRAVLAAWQARVHCTRQETAMPTLGTLAASVQVAQTHQMWQEPHTDTAISTETLQVLAHCRGHHHHHHHHRH